jgi:hypothetical protein
MVLTKYLSNISSCLKHTINDLFYPLDKDLKDKKDQSNFLLQIIHKKCIVINEKMKIYIIRRSINVEKIPDIDISSNDEGPILF